MAEQLQSLTLLSEPGVYEIATNGGPGYELDVPEALDDPGVLILDKVPGTRDLTGNEQSFKVFEAVVQVGEAGVFMLEKQDGSITHVETKPVASILKVD